MDLLRDRPPWTRANVDANGDPDREALLSRIDTAAAALARLQAESADGGGKDRTKLWERMLRLAPSTRMLIAELLCIPFGDERTALAFCLLKETARRVLLGA